MNKAIIIASVITIIIWGVAFVQLGILLTI